MLDEPLMNIRGIGEKRAALLDKLGLHTAGELIEYLPRTYLDYEKASLIAELHDGDTACVHVRITGAPRFFRKNGLTMVTARCADDTGAATLTWFNQPYRYQQISVGQTVYAYGRVSVKGGVSLLNAGVSTELPGIVPVYRSIAGLPQKTLRDAAYAALKTCFDELADPLPQEIREAYRLCTRQVALRHAHFPASKEILQASLERLQFEQLLSYLAAVELQKEERQAHPGIAFRVDGVREKFLKKLPFTPTNAQLRAMDELEKDLAAGISMNRLLQGDVGSGKTVLALYVLTVAAANGYQGALLAPTEILAEQHYESARAIFGNAAVLLTGGMKKASRDAALTSIKDGTAFCVVGTHALLQPDVRFRQLGVIVTDEQHRFGVRQRACIEEKGARPDVLVMSATPIPRTLALMLYGDLEVSVLDELPPGRIPIKTRIIAREKREDMYRYLAEQAKTGAQTYIVCPFIEDPEEESAVSVESLYRELKTLVPGLRTARLHGRMKEDAKRRTIQAFRDGEIDALITTTVIEVGVHVENACILVVEGAERFGLSQLHQLRGRVGRGKRQSYCFLLQNGGGEAAEKRMEALVHTSDGFEIAEEDLRVRGPGDLFGFRQHGDGDPMMMDALLDTRRIHDVRDALQRILAVPNDANTAFLRYAAERYERTFDTIAMN